jgi:hypothetical protein
MAVAAEPGGSSQVEARQGLLRQRWSRLSRPGLAAWDMPRLREARSVLARRVWFGMARPAWHVVERPGWSSHEHVRIRPVRAGSGSSWRCKPWLSWSVKAR